MSWVLYINRVHCEFSNDLLSPPDYLMHFSLMRWPEVRKLAGMMRIGKKYQLDDIFEEALERLKARLPWTIAAYDSSLYEDYSDFPEWIMIFSNDIICLGEEMAIWSILPIAYYLGTYYAQGIVSPRYWTAHQTLNTSISFGTVKVHLFGTRSLT